MGEMPVNRLLLKFFSRSYSIKHKNSDTLYTKEYRCSESFFLMNHLHPSYNHIAYDTSYAIDYSTGKMICQDVNFIHQHHSQKFPPL